MTPVSSTTTVGSVRVAIDARTFVPLRVQVFAGATRRRAIGRVHERLVRALGQQPVRVHSPAGATVRSQALPSPRGLMGAAPVSHKDVTRATSLTLTQAKAAAARDGLALTAPGQGSLSASLAFKGAAVSPRAKGHGATAVLYYGTGFGSVVLVESQGASGSSAGLPRRLAGLPRA